MSAEIVRTSPADLETSQLWSDCYWDPSLYSTQVLRRIPHPWQAESDAAIAEQLRDGCCHHELVAKKSRGAGGTDEMCALAHWFMGTRFGAKGIDTAPAFRQVESIFWPTFREQYFRSILPEIGFGKILETRIDFGENYFLEGLSTEKDVRAEGYHSLTGVFLGFDEAKGIRKSVFGSFVGTLTTAESLSVVASTPGFEFGHFYDLWTGPKTEGLIRMDISGARCLAEGVPYADVLERKLRDKFGVDSDEYRSQWLAKFLRAMRGGIIRWSDIERAMERHDAIRAGLIVPSGLRHSSLDIAASEKGKGDKSVLGNFVGDDLIEVHVWQIRDTTEMHRDALMRASSFGSIALRPDTPGLGIGVMNELRHASKEKFGGRIAVEEYWEGGPPADSASLYANRHSEAVNVTATKLKAGTTAIPRLDSDGHEIPWRELIQYRKHATDAHKYKVTKKGKDEEGRTMESPDFGDMLCIGLAPGVPDKNEQALAIYQKRREQLTREGRV